MRKEYKPLKGKTKRWSRTLQGHEIATEFQHGHAERSQPVMAAPRCVARSLLLDVAPSVRPLPQHRRRFAPWARWRGNNLAEQKCMDDPWISPAGKGADICCFQNLRGRTVACGGEHGAPQLFRGEHVIRP